MNDKPNIIVIGGGMAGLNTTRLTSLQLEFGEDVIIVSPEEAKQKVVLASYLRNCLIHNLSRADYRLSQVSDYAVNQDIEVTISQVHSFGIIARTLARSLSEQSNDKYFKNQ